MFKDPLNVVVCGHVDHGKSTLIGRLLFETNSIPKEKKEEIEYICRSSGKDIELSYLMDQFIEERERNITIDTAQVCLRMHNMNYVLIDAPGHIEFLKNMITGATQADVAILLIDVAEGLKEQTRRHAFVLSMLRIKKLIVLINKMDLVNYNADRYTKVKKRISEMLSNLGISPLAYIPISAKNGDNICKNSKKMPWYKRTTLSDALISVNYRADRTSLPLRLPIQDIYKINNERIAVGRIVSGRMNVGDNVIIMPSNKEVKIKKIKIFNNYKRNAKSGDNVGVIFDNDYLLKRGCMVIDDEKSNKTSAYFLVSLLWLSEKPLKIGKKLTLRCSTQKTKSSILDITDRIDISTMQFMGDKIINNNEVATIKIKTINKIFAEQFDYISSLGRFILESNSGVKAIGIIRKIL